MLKACFFFFLTFYCRSVFSHENLETITQQILLGNKTRAEPSSSLFISGGPKSIKEGFLLDQAKKRMALFETALKDQIDTVYPLLLSKVLISKVDKQRLPKSVQPFIEEEVEDIEGTWQRICTGRSTEPYDHILLQKNGPALSLYTPSSLKPLPPPQSQVKIRHGYQIPTVTGGMILLA